MVDSIASEWLADYKCHLALSFDQEGKKDVKKMTMLLMESSTSLFLNNSVLNNAGLLLKEDSEHVSSGIAKRVLLNCLAIRCCLINERDVLFSDINNSRSSLSPGLSALDLAEKLIKSSSWFSSLRRVIYFILIYLQKTDGREKTIKVYEKYSKYVKNKRDFPEIPTSFTYESYVECVMNVLKQLNQCLDLPFLFKVQNRLKINAGDESGDVEQDKSKKICELIKDSLNVLQNNSRKTDISDEEQLIYEFPSRKMSHRSISSSPNKVRHLRVRKRHHKIVQVQKPLRKKWTAEEDAFIIQKVKTLGYQWSVISKLDFFSGMKSGMQIKDRWRTLLTKGLVTLNSSGKVEKFDPSYHSFM